MPQTWNRNAYVLGNPMTLADPRGLFNIPFINPFAGTITDSIDVTAAGIRGGFGGLGADLYIGAVVDPIVERNAGRQAEIDRILMFHDGRTFLQCVEDGDARLGVAIPPVGRLAGASRNAFLRGLERIGVFPRKLGAGGRLQPYTRFGGEYVAWAMTLAGRSISAATSGVGANALGLSQGFLEGYSGIHAPMESLAPRQRKARAVGKALGAICSNLF